MELNFKVDMEENKSFVNFISKYEINDDKNIDDVAEFYLALKDKIDFSCFGDIYTELIHYRENPRDREAAEFFGQIIDFRDEIEDDENSFVKIEGIRFSNFYEVSSNLEKYYSLDDKECIKLWFNVKYNNQIKIIRKIIDDFFAKDSENYIYLKFDSEYQRNDQITIYTDYNNAPKLIDFIIKSSQENPDLFEKGSRDNPFVLKINDFIYYADCSSSVSYPQQLGKMFKYIDDNCTDLNKYSDKKAYLKSIILKGMAEEEFELCNPDHIALFRNDEYKRIELMSLEEREKYFKKLSNMSDDILKNISRR